MKIEPEPKNKEGYRSSDLSELNDSNMKEIDAKNRVYKIAEGQVRKNDLNEACI